MLLLTIIKIISRIQMMFQPSNKRKIPATILPSVNLVTTPQIQEVTGIIAKITLTR